MAHARFKFNEALDAATFLNSGTVAGSLAAIVDDPSVSCKIASVGGHQVLVVDNTANLAYMPGGAPACDALPADPSSAFAAFQPAQFTISLWFYIASIADIGSNNTLFFLTWPEPSNNSVANLAFIVNASGGNWIKCGTDYFLPTLTMGAWHHIAVTYDGTILNTYVDGALVDTEPSGVSFSYYPTTVFGIGGLRTEFGNARIGYSDFIVADATWDAWIPTAFAAGPAGFPAAPEAPPTPASQSPQPVGPYRRYQRATRPPWLLQPQGEAWSDGTAELKDELAEDLLAAVQARLVELAPWDALTLLGTERTIARAPADTDAQYAARVRGAWDLWALGGTAHGVLRALFDFGYRGMHLMAVNGGADTSLDGSGNPVIAQLGSWSIDATLTFWSKFQVLFTWPLPWGTVPDSGSAEVASIRRAVRDWAPGFVTSGIAVQTAAGQLWGWPRRTWGTWSVWSNDGASVLW